MRRRTVISVCLTAASLGALLLLGGCTPATQATSTWLDAAARDINYQRVLVVALTQEGDKRISFEDELAQKLSVGETRAWPSSELMDTSLAVTADSIRPVTREINADAVVITLVANMQVRSVDTQPYTDVTARRKPGSAFRYDYVEKTMPSVIKAEFSIELHTDVVDVKSGQTVYTLQTTTTDQDSIDDVIAVLTGAIAKQLKADNVVR